MDQCMSRPNEEISWNGKVVVSKRHMALCQSANVSSVPLGVVSTAHSMDEYSTDFPGGHVTSKKEPPHATCVQWELSAQCMGIPADPLNRHAPSAPGPAAAGAVLLSGTCALPYSSPLVIRKEFCSQGRLFYRAKKKQPQIWWDVGTDGKKRNHDGSDFMDAAVGVGCESIVSQWSGGRPSWLGSPCSL